MPGARIVDLRDSTVMPGFIDMHVHLRGLDDRLQARLQTPQRDYEDEAYTALINARKTLLAGFTTVRDLGNEPRMITTLARRHRGGPVRRSDHRRGRAAASPSPAAMATSTGSTAT